MPKKFGINTKKQEANERKDQVKKEKEIKELQRMEDEYWQETDEKILKKQNKAKEKEEQRLAEIQKKKELKEELEREEEELRKNCKIKSQPVIVTKSSAMHAKEEDLQKLDKKQENTLQASSYTNDQIDIEKDYVNENFLKMEEYKDYIASGIDVIEGSGLDSVMESLNIEGGGINHPEKKMRASWNAYVEKYYNDMKKQYPKYRRGKLLDMLSKDFHKSTENPMVVFKMYKQREQLKAELLNNQGGKKKKDEESNEDSS